MTLDTHVHMLHDIQIKHELNESSVDDFSDIKDRFLLEANDKPEWSLLL